MRPASTTGSSRPGRRCCRRPLSTTTSSSCCDDEARGTAAMVMANTERISKALDLLRDGLRPKCEETWQGFFGDQWLDEINSRMHHPQDAPSTDDVAFLFHGMKAVSYTHLRAHETDSYLVCRLLLEKK